MSKSRSTRTVEVVCGEGRPKHATMRLHTCACRASAGVRGTPLRLGRVRRTRASPAPLRAALEANAETGNVIEVFSPDELQAQLDQAGDKLVVLDIATKTCGPCKLIFPTVVEMSKEYTDAVFLKIMGDHDAETRALMKQWGVKAVPMFKFFKNGEQVHSHTGGKPDKLKSYFTEHYGA